jgi:hypothetical protein
MAGILVEYARFVEVQQRRARIPLLLMPPLGDTPAEPNSSAAAEEHPIEIGESRREFRSMQSDAADPPADPQGRAWISYDSRIC